MASTALCASASLLAAIAFCASVGAQEAQRAPVVPAPIQPPLMGWASWNALGHKDITAAKILAQARGMVALNAHITSGPTYRYVNIDEGWWMGKRDAGGQFIIDERAWPGGMGALAEQVHAMGLKAGIYIDAGPQGCGGAPFTGSDPDHYDRDFLQFARWGYDFVKVDFCGGNAAGYDPRVAYRQIAAAIQKAQSATGHKLMLNICVWGEREPWTWAPGLTASPLSWRTTYDIYNPFSAKPPRFKEKVIARNLWGNAAPEAQHSGQINDADMMVAGLGMSAVQDRAHVSLWAVAGTSMILGNDLSKPMSRETQAMLTNPEVIALQQDALGLQGIYVKREGPAKAPHAEVWAKRLVSAGPGQGRRAVALFNESASPRDIRIELRQIGLDASAPATVRDVWARKDVSAIAFKGGHVVAKAVPPDGVQLLVVDGSEAAPLPHALAHPSAGRWELKGLDSPAHGQNLQVIYRLKGTQPQRVRLEINGAYATTLVLPPSAQPAALSVYAGLKIGKNHLTLSMDPGADVPALELLGIEQVAGPQREWSGPVPNRVNG